MREFRDDQGRPWMVALTVAAAMRVRDNVTRDVDGTKVPFDIVDIGSISQTMQVLRCQYTTLAEALYFIVHAQVQQKGLTKEQFLDGLRGDALDAASQAIEGELIDFFPERLRKMVALLSAKWNEATNEAMQQAERTIAEATATDLVEASGNPSTSVPASSESIRANGLSESSPPLAMPA